MSDEKKGNFFDKLKKAMDQAPVPSWAPKPATPVPPASRTAPIKPEPAKPDPKRTDNLMRSPATAQLGTGAKRTAPLPEDTIPEMPDIPPEEELSPRRLAMIDDFMTGKAKVKQMKDPTFMYKVVSDERAYQTQLLFTLQEQIQALRPDQTAEAEALQGRIRRSQAIVTNLFKVLKYITGKKGKTGGTDFLSEEK